MEEKNNCFCFFTVLSSLSATVLSLLVRYFEQFEIQNGVVSSCHHGPVQGCFFFCFFLCLVFCSVLFLWKFGVKLLISSREKMNLHG